MSSAPSLHAVMTEAEYDAARAELSAFYGNTVNEMVARRDQALARLFARSGWTQEKIAKKEGKSQSWITKRLLFGRFLEFSTMVLKPENLPRNLNERRFRELWAKTDQSEGNERIRFQQVLKFIEDNIRIGRTLGPKGYTKILREKFADGQWYALSEIAETVNASQTDTHDAIRKMRDVDVEHRLKGRDQHDEYRLFPKDKTVSTIELADKLGPLIKELKIEGKKNMATMVPAVVAMIAEKLQHLLDDWTS